MSNYDDTRKVYEQISGSYIKGVSEVPPFELTDFISLLEKEDKVLEVGTAGGRDAKVFSDAGMEVIGTDVVDSFLVAAKKLVPEATFVNRDMRELDFDSDEFNAVWANAVLLHAERADALKIIQNFYRMLKPKGKLHIRVKEGEGESFREEKLSSGKRRFFVYYSQREVEQLLEVAGFKVIRSRVMNDERGREDTKWVSVWGEKVSRDK